MSIKDKIKLIGLLNVLCECHVYVPEDEQEMIRRAVADNLPEGWQVKRILDRLEIGLADAN